MKITLIALLSLAGTFGALAQNSGGGGNSGPSDPKPTVEEFYQDGVWNGVFKGGRYLLKSNQIIALSKHEYIADSVARVVEINLTLNSGTHVRFYYLEPVRLEGGGVIGAGQQAIDKARALVQDAATRVSPTLTDPKVVKNYPVSTHSHTIEFVLKEEARLNSLFNSLEGAFRDPGKRYFWRE